MESYAPSSEEIREYSRWNMSELYQYARRNGRVVPPNLPREKLIAIILGYEDPPADGNVVDDIRRAIMSFLIDHRRALETQIRCPARSFSPDACFECVDAQVFSCLVSNGAENQRLIQLHIKPHPQ